MSPSSAKLAETLFGTLSPAFAAVKRAPVAPLSGMMERTDDRRTA